MSEEEYYSFVRRNPGIVSLDLDLDKNVLGNHILLSNCENLEILRLRCSKGSGKKMFFMCHIYISSKILLLTISDCFILKLIDKCIKVKRIQYAHNDGTEIPNSRAFDTD